MSIRLPRTRFHTFARTQRTRAGSTSNRAHAVWTIRGEGVRLTTASRVNLRVSPTSPLRQRWPDDAPIIGTNRRSPMSSSLRAFPATTVRGARGARQRTTQLVAIEAQRLSWGAQRPRSPPRDSARHCAIIDCSCAPKIDQQVRIQRARTSRQITARPRGLEFLFHLRGYGPARIAGTSPRYPAAVQSPGSTLSASGAL